MYIYVRIKNKMVYKYIFFINVYLYIYKNRWNVGIIKKWLSGAVYTFQQLKKLVGIYKMCRGCKNLIVVPKKWTNNTGGYYNNITVQFVMEVS